MKLMNVDFSGRTKRSTTGKPQLIKECEFWASSVTSEHKAELPASIGLLLHITLEETAANLRRVSEEGCIPQRAFEYHNNLINAYNALFTQKREPSSWSVAYDTIELVADVCNTVWKDVCKGEWEPLNLNDLV